MTRSNDRESTGNPTGIPVVTCLWALVAATLLSSCAWAPGFRYGTSGPDDGSIDTTGTFEGIPVHVQALTPRVALQAGVAEDTSNSGTPVPELLAFQPPSYRLGKHDVITITIWEHPELTMPLGEYRADNAVGQTLDDSGQFFFPFIGATKAEGLTPAELRRSLQVSLSKVLNSPQLDVKITGYRSQKVFMTGSVVRPGPIYLNDIPTNLLDAISLAGGLGPGANPKRVELRRGARTYLVDLEGGRMRGSEAHRIFLQNGDIVRVQSADENKIYVMGEVERQSAIPVAGHVSLVNALALSGGLNLLSARSQGIYVIRGEDAPRIRVWHLSAKNPMALALADRFPLKPGDIVYVDATNLATWNRVINLLTSTSTFLNQNLGSATMTRNLIP